MRIKPIKNSLKRLLFGMTPNTVICSFEMNQRSNQERINITKTPNIVLNSLYISTKYTFNLSYRTAKQELTKYLPPQLKFIVVGGYNSLRLIAK